MRCPSLRLAFAALALLGAWAAPGAAAAEDPPARPAGDALSLLGEFLDLHPGIEARLRENPESLGSPAFQQNHPQIVRYFANHPEIAAALARHPRWLLHRELNAFSATPLTPAQHAEFDRFLDEHPAIAKALTQHPRLLRYTEFMRAHPELHEYLRRQRLEAPKPPRPPKAERRP